MVPQILALTQKLQDRGGKVKGARAAASSGQCHRHTFSWAWEPTSEVRGETGRANKFWYYWPLVSNAFPQWKTEQAGRESVWEDPELYRKFP